MIRPSVFANGAKKAISAACTGIRRRSPVLEIAFGRSIYGSGSSKRKCFHSTKSRSEVGLYRTDQYCLLTPAVYREREIERAGKRYGRCDENILERKYWVIEFDIGEGQPAWKGILPSRHFTGFDLQAATILHLMTLEFPIVSIVHSGGKSLHAWCSGHGMTNEEIEAKILSTAVYGADVKAGLAISQFFRLPNPVHPTRPQRLLYLNSDFINHGRTS
jgi:hypothetical protein